MSKRTAYIINKVDYEDPSSQRGREAAYIDVECNGEIVHSNIEALPKFPNRDVT
jgi:hypothetical protein